MKEGKERERERVRVRVRERESKQRERMGEGGEKGKITCRRNILQNFAFSLSIYSEIFFREAKTLTRSGRNPT